MCLEIVVFPAQRSHFKKISIGDFIGKSNFLILFIEYFLIISREN
jgi:hypothetical protein